MVALSFKSVQLSFFLNPNLLKWSELNETASFT